MKSKETVKNRIINIDYEKNKISWLYYMPLLLIAGFVPLIVYGKYFNLNGTTQALFWTGQNEILDFFSYWKSRWVIFLTATSLIIYIFLFGTKKLPLKREYKYYIPLAIYAFFVILSTIFAIDVPTALNGFVDMYQGMWVLLSYVTITFLVINFVNSERDIKLFLYVFIFLIIVEGLIGVGQYFGFDIFNTKFGNSLIIPSGVNIEGGLQFNFGKHTIYGTLFNTNFVGSFATLMLPMVVVFLISAKSLKKRIIASVALTLCVFTWIGCNSRAGYIGMIFSMLVFIVMFRKYLFRNWKKIFSHFLVIIIFIVLLNYVSDGIVCNQIQRLSIFKELDKVNSANHNDEILMFEDIIIEDNIVKIKSNFQELNIKISGEKLFFVDENGNQLPMKTNDEGYLVIDDTNPSHLGVEIFNDYPGFSVNLMWASRDSLNFYISGSEIKMIASGGRIITYEDVPRINFLDKYDNMLSSRVYIWSRTIPMLNKHFVIGAGSDNFPIAFPQDDFIAKHKANMSISTVIDKPHNMYLQTAVNTGVISLIALLTLWGIYIISSIKLYWKINLNSLDKYLGLACLLSVIGYLVAGIFNDYIVSVAPIFWIILGLGIGINIRLNKKGGDNV